MNRRDMLKTFGLGACVAAGGMLGAGSKAVAAGAGSSDWQRIVERSMVDIGAHPASTDLVVLTNAGAGELNGKPTLSYVDQISKITGRTIGDMGLMTIQTPLTEPLWVALYNKKNGKLAFMKQTGAKPESQVTAASYDQITKPEAWADAREGLLGSRIFSVVSISQSWAAGASWRLLRASELHNHICPGLNSGYIMGEYVLKNFPLPAGNRLVFVGAPPFCANDAFQTMFDATVGKKGTFSMMVNKAGLKKKYGPKFESGQFVLHLDPKAKTCDGLLLNLDDAKVAAMTGVPRKELSPEGGSKNPMFHISRVKRAVKLAEASLPEKLKLIVVLDSFKGDTAMADEIMGRGFDPYAEVHEDHA